jgi:hypothetical protein
VNCRSVGGHALYTSHGRRSSQYHRRSEPEVANGLTDGYLPGARDIDVPVTQVGVLERLVTKCETSSAGSVLC